MGRAAKRLGLAAWLVLLCFGVYQLQWAIERSRERRGTAEPLYLPNGKLLHVVSLGYDSAVADVLWLYSIQYAMEQFWGERKYVWLQHIFDLITELDPQFEAAYIQGAMFLGMMQRRPEMALKLLEKGKKNNPDSWIYPAEQSFYAAIHLKDRKRAIAYVQEAADKPGSPPQLYSRLANLYRKTGKQELALRQWLQLEKSTSDPKFRKVAQENVAWLMRALAKQYPKFAATRWRQIAAATDDKDFAAVAAEQIRQIEERLAKLAPEQHGPEALPDTVEP